MSLPAVIKASLPATIVPLIEWRTRAVFGSDGQFERTAFDGATLRAGASIEDLRKALGEVERQLQPADEGDRVIDALAPLYATRRNRPGEQLDQEAMLAVYAERLKTYPWHIIRQAGDRFLDVTPWWPAISEFLPVLDELMRPLRALKAALEEAIARANRAARPALAPPAPLPTQQERLRTASLLRRQAGDDRTAARFERDLAKIEGRPVEQWAQDAVAQQLAEQKARAEEFQRLADAEKAEPKAKTETDAYLAEKAQARRDEILGVKGDKGEAA